MFCVKNRLLSLLIRLIGLAGLSVLLAFYIASLDGLVWFFRYEIQAGILFLGTLFFEVIFNSISLRYGVLGYPGGVYMPFKLAVTVYTLLSTFLHIVVPWSTLEGEKTLIGAAYSFSFLLFALIDWVFFDEKGTVKYSAAFIYSIYPIFYLIFCVFRPYIFGKTPLYHDGTYVPYGYMDPEHNAPVTFILVSILVIIGLGLFTILLNDLFSGKFKRRIQDY